MALMDSRMLNDVLPPNQLSNIRVIVLTWAQRPSAKAQEDSVQQLLSEVQNMSMT